MASVAEAAAAAKTAIWQRLTTTPGLREADGIRVVSASVSPDELGFDTWVELGDITIAAVGNAGFARREWRMTMAGHVTVTDLVGDEEAIQATRNQATALMALVEATVADDPTADQAIGGPGGTAVNVLALQETPAQVAGQAARRASCPFTVTWSSHL
jgi:hypothetical protein